MVQLKNFLIPANYTFQDKSSVYLFTNENISDYLQVLGNVKGSRVLTVASSGDHAFEAYMAGASYVDTFDINSYQKHIIDLKNHMIRNLKYSDFMDYFFEKRSFLDCKIIKPLMPLFSNDLRSFVTSQAYVSRDLFKYRGINKDHDISKLSYLSNQSNYDKLATLLPKKISFTHCSIEHLVSLFHQEYDIIMLSNIFDYLYNDIYSREAKINYFYNKILSPLSQELLSKCHGKITFDYIWSYNMQENWTDFFHYFEKKYSIPTKHRLLIRCASSALHTSPNPYDAVLLLCQNQY